ncbi:ABC transporter substrate-binding protein [Saccharopolyspora indica]|uniref:ABC transporter substrate-binding protein n=1 Tax=Saccharopolyspora indica TaxID=1229659 RepID=UPI0022EB52D7|nr:ABC transporter substrate-binding protein [Saccharopolyspora indica]MDA3647966.1 ABC transporter substrate-binding protein [Saccharopolyspora indica]
MRISHFACAAGTVVALAGCSAAPLDSTTARSDVPGYLAVADGAVPAGGTLDLQMTVDIGAATGLDPQLADVATSWQLMSLVYETLVTVGPDFGVQPALAESWETPSPTEYVFHLRDAVTFSNGRAMTADDVVGSLQRLLAGQGVWQAQVGPVERVSAVDDRTVAVKLSRPYAPFLAALANVPAAVLPMKEISEGSLDPAKTMLGTGPFEVETHRQDVSWRFKRRTGYWAAGKPAADTVTVVISAQEQARMAALQNGSADVAMLGNVDAPKLLNGARGTRIGAQTTTDFYYLMLNSNAPGGKFDDPRVRQAINIALDRQAMADSALGGLGRPTGVTPVALPGACDPALVPSAQADLDRARQLLREAGSENLTFRLAAYSTGPAPAVAQVIQQNLERIGIRVSIEQLDEGSWAGEVYGEVPATFDAALSWFAGYADAGMAGRWWNPEQAGFNAGFMAPNPALNAAIDKAIETPAGPERTTALQELCDAVDTDGQMIPLVTKPALVGFRSDAVSPTFYETEGYGHLFRGIADFRLRTD